jgi:antitoxin (DNA-binding transcriptional repressor) of toxin-antitoxin stability system
MKRYSAAQARAKLASLLDEAEDGQAVVIERRGVRFTLRAKGRARPRRSTRRPVIEFVDPAVLEGNWTWTWDEHGVRFRARKRRR